MPVWTGKSGATPGKIITARHVGGAGASGPHPEVPPPPSSVPINSFQRAPVSSIIIFFSMKGPCMSLQTGDITCAMHMRTEGSRPGMRCRMRSRRLSDGERGLAPESGPPGHGRSCICREIGSGGWYKRSFTPRIPCPGTRDGCRSRPLARSLHIESYLPVNNETRFGSCDPVARGGGYSVR